MGKKELPELDWGDSGDTELLRLSDDDGMTIQTETDPVTGEYSSKPLGPLAAIRAVLRRYPLVWAAICGMFLAGAAGGVWTANSQRAYLSDLMIRNYCDPNG